MISKLIIDTDIGLAIIGSDRQLTTFLVKVKLKYIIKLFVTNPQKELTKLKK